MFNSLFLDVAVALIFLYSLFSLMASTIKEWIAGIFDLRGFMLQDGIESLLEASNMPFEIQFDGAGAPVSVKRDETITKVQFFSHPAIASRSNAGFGFIKSWPFLSLNKPRFPSYLDANTFVNTYLTLMFPGNDPGVLDTAKLRKAIQIAEAKSADDLRAFLSLIANSVDNLSEGVKLWFNTGMDRISGWYKRKSQLILLLIATVLTIGANIDTIRIAREISHNTALRTAIVAAAEAPHNYQDTSKSYSSTIKNLNSQISNFDLPLGWNNNSGNKCEALKNWQRDLMKFLGLMITIIAISLGAPFWFDLLNNVVNLRYSGPKPDPKKNSRDS